MSSQFDAHQLREVMKSFYTLSGIRFVLFDANYREVLSYPERDCEFCEIMKSNPKTRKKCSYADKRNCQKCEQENRLVLYSCHAGLVEAVIPLHENEKIVGFVMFGQITDNPDKTALYNKALLFADMYELDSKKLVSSIDSISYKNSEEILAAAKIMEACTSYIIYKELITPESNKIFETAKNYIENHLGDNLGIDELCSALGIGRTRLYEIFRNELKMGISKYILRRRMHKAKSLLKNSDLSIHQIAECVGFTDYNYFSRVYKKTYGKSPKNYRKKHN